MTYRKSKVQFLPRLPNICKIINTIVSITSGDNMIEATIVSGAILFVVGFLVGKTQSIKIENVEHLRVETDRIVVVEKDTEDHKEIQEAKENTSNWLGHLKFKLRSIFSKEKPRG